MFHLTAAGCIVCPPLPPSLYCSLCLSASLSLSLSLYLCCSPHMQTSWPLSLWQSGHPFVYLSVGLTRVKPVQYQCITPSVIKMIMMCQIQVTSSVRRDLTRDAGRQGGREAGKAGKAGKAGRQGGRCGQRHTFNV